MHDNLCIKQQLIKEEACKLKFLWEPAYSSQLVFSVLFSFVNWIWSGSCSMNRLTLSKLLSEPTCSSQFDLHWASPHSLSPSVRIATQFWTFLFFRIYFCLLRDFVNQHVLLQIYLLWDRPKLMWVKERVCGHFVLKTIVMPFESDTCWSFYFCTSGTLCPILTLLTHFALHQFFHDAEYCFLTTDNAVDQRKAPDSLVCFFLFFLFFAFGSAFH